MEKYYYKYAILSSLISCLVWLVLSLIMDAMRLNVKFAPSVYLTDFLIPVVFIIGTYVGISVIGKIKKPSYHYALIIGLLSAGFFVLFVSFEILIWGILIAESWGINPLPLFSIMLPGGIIAQLPKIIIFPIVGVLIGVLLVRHSSPVTGTPTPY